MIGSRDCAENPVWTGHTEQATAIPAVTSLASYIRVQRHVQLEAFQATHLSEQKLTGK